MDKNLPITFADVKRGEHTKIPGLFCCPNILSHHQASFLLDLVDKYEDSGESIRNKIRKRVTMHFGHVFSASKLKVDFNDEPPKIDDKLRSYIDYIIHLYHPELLDWEYDQVTINRYYEKGGIGAHVDTHSSFDENILIISLGSPTVMRFQHCVDKDKIVDVWIPDRSMLLMSGESRYRWTHKISNRKTDYDPQGVLVHRGMRTSITVRKVIKTGICECKYPEACDYQNPSSFHVPDRVPGKDSESDSLEKKEDQVIDGE